MEQAMENKFDRKGESVMERFVVGHFVSMDSGLSPDFTRMTGNDGLFEVRI
ncbi:hypothetical protein NSMM_980012 [Nitrosomonas mobilis]|uniref:Uncharacterized protein n=1 Tax=Nitrosomonas mobilis TaxID=51642 RepID=A0A1G5SIZ9_9PROT|nr:hypothetical protein NSMM_980012 [Nitrosomonas mobilis]